MQTRAALSSEHAAVESWGAAPGATALEQQVMGFINVICGAVSAGAGGLINYLKISQ